MPPEARITFERRRRTAWAVLVTAVVAGAAWLLHLDLAAKISTDVLDLVPPAAASPEVAVVRSMANQAEAQTMLLTLHLGAGSSLDGAAELLAAELRTHPAFAEAMSLRDSSVKDALGRVVFEQRMALLFPSWLAERRAAWASVAKPGADFGPWLAKDTAQRLNAFVATPAAVAFQDLIPADPLLLVPNVVDRLKPALARLTPGSEATALVWARLAASPLSQAGQAPAFAAIERAASVVAARYPGTTLAYTGVNRFAAASRERIEREVTRLNLLSLAAVFAVAFVFIRNVLRALHLAPVVLLSTLGAWVGATLAFSRVHILVLVIGSLLTGVAIDYGFYLFMQPPAGPDEPYPAKVRRLAKPLLASCGTTAAGFALLLCSDLPVIRQIGVFVGTGLVCALISAVIYFGTVRDPYLPARDFRMGRRSPGARVWLRRLLVAAWLFALPGLLRLAWRDDIRDLEIPSAALRRIDAAVRGDFGETGGQSVYLTYGPTLGEARTHLDDLDAWLRARGASLTNLAAVIPSAADHRAAAAFAREHPEFAAQLRTALAAQGFEPDAFAAWESVFRECARQDERALAAATAALRANLKGPAGLLLHEGALCWWVTLADRPIREALPPALHTVARNQLETLNAVFARYRASALRLSALGLAIVGAGVFLTYGLRDGVRIFAIPCGACLGVFGVFGWVGLPLNLFHLLGAFLGVCLTHNYSIFTATSAYRRELPPPSVRLSAVTAAASFGVLALSGIPVVRALGSTVALMVVLALVSIELEHLRPLAQDGHE